MSKQLERTQDRILERHLASEARAARVQQIILSIEKRLDSLEDLMAFLVKANVRFKEGQRVQFSASADRKGISRRIKGGVRKGRVTKVNGYSITVLLDGYKRPSSFSHSFFDPISR